MKSDLDAPSIKAQKLPKPWQHHVGIGLKIFLILLGIAILFTALDLPCIALAFRGTRC